MVQNQGTELKQRWAIANGHIEIQVWTSKPMDEPAFVSLVPVMEAIEGFVYANQPALKTEGGTP